MGISWPEFPVVAAVMRSSTALGFSSFRDMASHMLKDTWNPNLSAYCPGSAIDYAVDTIILAKQHNLPYVLKRAYYELLRSPGFKQTGADPVAPLSFEEPLLLLKTVSPMNSGK